MTEPNNTLPLRGEVQHINPEGLNLNPAFTNVIAVTGPVKTVYIGGQDAIDGTGAIIGKGDIADQTEQIFKNLQIALTPAGVSLEHVIKWNIYMVQGQSPQPAFQVFQKVWGDRPNPPAITGDCGIRSGSSRFSV